VMEASDASTTPEEDQEPFVSSSPDSRPTQLGTNQVPDKDGRWYGQGCRADRQPHGLFLGHVGNYCPTGRWLSDPNSTTLDLYTSPTAASGSNWKGPNILVHTNDSQLVGGHSNRHTTPTFSSYNFTG
jgi:hypothetical protein